MTTPHVGFRAGRQKLASRRLLTKLVGKREDFRIQGLTDLESGVDHGVQFSPNVAHQPLTVCFEEEAKGSDDEETQLLSRPPRWAIVEQDLTGGNFERQRDRRGLTGIKSCFPRKRRRPILPGSSS